MLYPQGSFNSLQSWGRYSRQANYLLTSSRPHDNLWTTLSLSRTKEGIKAAPFAEKSREWKGESLKPPTHSEIDTTLIARFPFLSSFSFSDLPCSYCLGQGKRGVAVVPPHPRGQLPLWEAQREEEKSLLLPNPPAPQLLGAGTMGEKGREREQWEVTALRWLGRREFCSGRNAGDHHHRTTPSVPGSTNPNEWTE